MTANQIKQVTDKERQTKIQKVLLPKADEVYDKIRDHLFSTLDNEKAESLFKFLYEETYIAGGYFRSLIVDTPVNDVDIFFKTYRGAVKFRALMEKTNPPLPVESVSSNHSYSVKLVKRKDFPKLSFVTYKGASPLDMVSEFDFTFNQHYYSPFEGTYSFDNSTFNKRGVLLQQDREQVSHTNTLVRLLRFTREGWDISILNILNLIASIKNEALEDFRPNFRYTQSDITREVTLGTTGEEQGLMAALGENYDSIYDTGATRHAVGTGSSLVEGLNTTTVSETSERPNYEDFSEYVTQHVAGLPPGWEERVRSETDRIQQQRELYHRQQQEQVHAYRQEARTYGQSLGQPLSGVISSSGLQPSRTRAQTYSFGSSMRDPASTWTIEYNPISDSLLTDE